MSEDEAQAWIDEALHLLQQGLESDDVGLYDTAVRLLAQALEALPPDHEDRPMVFSTLGSGLQARFERTGVLKDLDAAVEASRRAVKAAMSDDPNRDAFLSSFSETLRLRFEHIGALADLDLAVEAGWQAVRASPSISPFRAAYFSSLGATLAMQFERTGTLRDIDAAIDACAQAVRTAPPDVPGREAYLSNLSNALRSRFEGTGELADIDAAIDTGRQAVDTMPPEHPHRAISLSNLGIALLARFERTGALTDIDAAIDAGRLAVEATPLDHPYRPARLSNLASAMMTRSERTGVLADLDAAVDAGWRAVEVTSRDHPDRAIYLTNLGNALLTRFGRSGRLADLEAGVKVTRRAADAAPPDHPDLPLYLSNLGRALCKQFERTGAPADIDAAVRLLTHARDATPAGHARSAGYLAGLAGALLTRSLCTRTMTDLDMAVDASEMAVGAIPPDHPDRAGYLLNLGHALMTRFEVAGTTADLDAALGIVQAAAEMEIAAPRARISAARMWGSAAALGQRWDQAVAGFTTAVGLLGELAPRELSRSDQENLLAEISGLGMDAAACAIRAGDPSRAVELFEHGRGVLLGQALDLRGDLSDLQRLHLPLYDQFVELAMNLDHLGPAGALALEPIDGKPSSRTMDVGRWARERRELRAQFDQLIEQIRGHDGFADFLRPAPLTQLVQAASGGPVVVVIVSRFGSYALILTQARVAAPVELPRLTPDAITSEVADFLALLDPPDPSGPPDYRPDSGQQREGITRMLSWLWDGLAGPVLEQLPDLGPPAGYTAPSEPRRVWWCLSGPLALLPVHAAGRPEPPNGPRPHTMIDRVASSYTPTLRALLHTRRAASAPQAPVPGAAGARRGQAVAVAMPHTPDDADLPGVEAELRALRRRLPETLAELVGAQAQRESVRAALREARWAHVACHAYSDPTSPSASRLLLHDYRERPFTVVDVARLRLDHADLAYLSACSTAHSGERLADEAIHLASAFQLAGYRHVIATLWPVPDLPARRAAGWVYDHLSLDGPDVGLAVHTVTLALRRRYPDHPEVWAAFVHVGA